MILWFHDILKLRTFPFIVRIDFIGLNHFNYYLRLFFQAVTLDAILQLWQSVAPVFAVKLLVICAFTNLFMTLLYDLIDSYFQVKYVGNITNLVPPTTSHDTTVQDISRNNQFGDPLKAFYTVRFFMYVLWDPAVNGDAGENVMIMILAILFTFLTVFIFSISRCESN